MNPRSRRATSGSEDAVDGSLPVTVEDSEAALVEHYPRLVPLASGD